VYEPLLRRYFDNTISRAIGNLISETFSDPTFALLLDSVFNIEGSLTELVQTSQYCSLLLSNTSSIIAPCLGKSSTCATKTSKLLTYASTTNVGATSIISTMEFTTSTVTLNAMLRQYHSVHILSGILRHRRKITNKHMRRYCVFQVTAEYVSLSPA